MTTSDTAILVASCDRYSDLWGPFFGVLAKRWPDCPLPIYLGMNHRGLRRRLLICARRRLIESLHADEPE